MQLKTLRLAQRSVSYNKKMHEDSLSPKPSLSKLEKHRFQVPEHSAKTLRHFENELRSFTMQHPEIVGVTVFGSQVKGTARAEGDPKGKSDIDAFIFVDETIAGLSDEVLSGVSTTKDSPNWRQMHYEVERPFITLFAKAANYSESDLKDVRLRLLSQSRIDHDLQGMQTFLTDLTKYEAGTGTRPNFDQRPDSDLARIFHIQLGNQLNEYRSYVLHSLKRLGPIGDQIWERFFYRETLSFENGKLVKGMSDEAVQFIEKRNALYPHTVDQAIEYFHLQNVPAKYSLKDLRNSS